MTFDNIDYLRNGNEIKQGAYTVLTENSIFEKLRYFLPLLTGTIPINIDIDESDLDIICYWTNKEEFIKVLTEAFSKNDKFTLTGRKINTRETILGTFQLGDFNVKFLDKIDPHESRNPIGI